MNTRLALILGFVAAAAQARPFVITTCPTATPGVGTIVLNTNQAKTEARSVTVKNIPFGTQTQVVDQTVASLKYVPAGAGGYRIEFTDLEDGRSVAVMSIWPHQEPVNEGSPSLTEVSVEYVNGESESFRQCNIVNEGLLQKLAK